jgi:uncharacterized RDD family membrane protein YckC
MRSILKNPFVIAIAAVTAVGSSCGLLTGLITKDMGDVLTITGALVLVLLVPALLLPFLGRFVPPPRRSLPDEPSLGARAAWEPTSFQTQAIPQRQPHAEHISNPPDRALEAFFAVLLVAAVDLIWGVLAWFFPRDALQPVGISLLSAVCGMGLLALGHFVLHGSVAALVTAIVVVSVDSVLGVVSLPRGYAPEVELAFLRISMLLMMIRGIKSTIAMRKAGERTSALRGSTALPVQTAPLPQRFLAAVIDLSLLGIAEGCWSLLGGLVWTHGGIAPVQEWHVVVWGIIAVAVPAIYFIWPYSTSGQTPGKRVLEIKVISTDGSPLDWRTGMLRTAGYILSSIPLGLGFVWSTWQDNRQAGHDKVAGTLVVPASVAREHLQGVIEPWTVRRTQGRWLLGLGIPSLFVYIGFFRQVGEIRSAHTLPVALSAADVGQALVAAGTAVLVALIPATLVAFLVAGVLTRKPRLTLVVLRRKARRGPRFLRNPKNCPGRDKDP